jgi:ATP dependent DNA ligase domain
MNVATFAHKWRIRSGERLQLGRILSPQDRGVRLLTRNGKDWTGRFPTIVEAAAGLKARSCLIDGEVVCCDSQYRESELGYASRVRSSLSRWLFWSSGSSAWEVLPVNARDAGLTAAFDAVDGSSTGTQVCHRCGRCWGSHDSEELIMQTVTTIGLDIAKSVFSNPRN